MVMKAEDNTQLRIEYWRSARIYNDLGLHCVLQILWPAVRIIE
jgi:hypothetical protein